MCKRLYECMGCVYYEYHKREDYMIVCSYGNGFSYRKVEVDNNTQDYIIKDCPKRNVVKFKKINPDAVLPFYTTEGSAGFDLSSVENVVVGPKETKVVKTGLVCELPSGYELQIRPRSGLSLKTPLRIANTPGTVDSDYRGEIGIIVWNTGDDPYEIVKGIRIAQGVVCKVEQLPIEEVDTVSETARSSGGFGSTGI